MGLIRRDKNQLDLNHFENTLRVLLMMWSKCDVLTSVMSFLQNPQKCQMGDMLGCTFELFPVNGREPIKKKVCQFYEIKLVHGSKWASLVIF